MLKQNFKGRGTLAKFAKETNSVMSAINNISIIVPSGYSGVEPTIKFEDGEKGCSLIFDFGDALIFTLKNVSWSLSGTANFVSKSVSVDNGVLYINVVANDIP